MAEMRVVLREVLRRAELATTTAAGEVQRVKHVILIPDRGGRIQVNQLRVPSNSTRTDTHNEGRRLSPRDGCRAA